MKLSINIFKKEFLLVSFVLLINCDIPKDTNDSWENITQSGLQVGMVSTSENSMQNDFIKEEYALVKSFAMRNGLKINFVEGSETTLINKLEKYELNAVIGGFDKKSSWKKKVGMTALYDDEHVMFITKGENEFLFQLNKFIYANK